MKNFFKRAGLFAVANALLIGLLALVTKLTLDTCIILSCIFFCFIGLPYEFYLAHKEERRPDIGEGWGAAVFGTLVIAFIIYGIYLLF